MDSGYFYDVIFKKLCVVNIENRNTQIRLQFWVDGILLKTEEHVYKYRD